jgi:LysR family glycine cleavage system transcriptional activator
MTGQTSIRHISALRSFEAAARLRSFQAAADELHLTPSAISHQIRRLETNLGQALFVRTHRKVDLTAAGQTLQGYVTRGFAEFSRGIHAISDATRAAELRVSVAPTFAAAYLTPRIEQFERINPALRLRLDMSQNLVDFERGEFDAVIRMSARPPSGLFAEPVSKVRVAPVCSPAIGARLRSVAGLRQVTRIIISQAPDAWARWHRAFGREDQKPRREVRFDPMTAGLQAAIDGVGVMIAPVDVIRKQVQEGRLMLPFDQIYETTSIYRFLCRRGDETLPKIVKLRNWLHQAVRDEERTAAQA